MGGATDSSFWQSLKRFLFGRNSLWAFVPVIVVLLASAALNLTYNRALAETRERVTHSLRVNNAIDAVMSAMQDIETGQRGYLITGEASYLEPFRRGISTLPAEVVRLAGLIRDNADQRAAVDDMRVLIGRKLNEVTATIAARRREGFDAARALVANDEGKRTMDLLRALITRMRDTENLLLERRMATMRRTERGVLLVALVGLALALAGRLAVLTLQLHFRRRRRRRGGG